MEQAHQNIESYLNGDLSELELIEFEHALQSDASLAESVAQHREMMRRLDALRIRNKVKAAARTQRQTGQARYVQRKYWALAASLVLIAAAVWFFYQQVNPERSDWVDKPVPPNTTEQPVPIPETAPADQIPDTSPDSKPDDKRPRQLALAREHILLPSSTMIRDAAQQSDVSAPKTIAQQAAEAFEKQQYRIAANLLKNDPVVEQDDALRFLRANARFQIGEFAKAALDFEALQQSFQFKHEARWNAMLCLLAQGKSAEAKHLLDAMLQETDFPFQEKAKHLKQAIDKR